MKTLLYLFFGLLVVFSTSGCTNKGSFTLVNHSKEMIKTAVVIVCGQTVQLSDIDPGNSASSEYKVKADSSYDVTVSFQSGQKIHKAVGYVTNGMDFHHDILVSDNDIEI
jgi:hypothetical protein